MEVTWADFWGVCKDFLLPETATVVWSLVLYGVLGFVLAVVLLVLGQRFKVFTRSRKYYNWAVKLYIPLIIIGTLYFALQLGLFRGIWKVMDNEAEVMTEGVYTQTVDRLFVTPAEKDAFLAFCKLQLVTYEQSSEVFIDTLKAQIMDNNTGVGLLDEAKNKVSVWLIDTFKDEIFSAIVFGALSKAAEKSGIPVEASWSESAKMMEVLLRTDVAHLEVEIKRKITETLQKLFHSQYSSVRKSTWIMWFLIVLFVPLVEWAIYVFWLRKWLEKRKQASEQALELQPDQYGADK
jgi:hypothetical protein